MAAFILCNLLETYLKWGYYDTYKKSAGAIWKDFLDFLVQYYSLADPCCCWSFAIGSVNKKMSFWYDICTAKLSFSTSGSEISLVSQDTVSADLKKIRLENFTRIFSPKSLPYWLTCNIQNPTEVIVSPPMFWIYFHTKTKTQPLNIIPKPYA